MSGSKGMVRLQKSCWSHRFAVLTAALTLPLLFMGGLVTTKGVGLIVPDWPTTFGENMFFFPWSKMIGGVFYEHSHRLLGATVGLATLLLALCLWLREERKWVRGLGVGALLLVIVQGVLGGLRVVLVENTLALVHACLAQAFFAAAVALAIVTSAAWHERRSVLQSREAEKVRRLALLTTGLVYAQIVLGAVLRHTGAQLETHLIVAALVTVHVLLLLRIVWRIESADARLSRGAAWLGLTLAVQLGLGFGAYLGKFHPGTVPYVLLEWLTTGHVVGASLLLASALSITLWSYRLLPPGAKVKSVDLVAGEVGA